MMEQEMGLEPTTLSLEGRCSAKLSYSCRVVPKDRLLCALASGDDAPVAIRATRWPLVTADQNAVVL